MICQEIAQKMFDRDFVAAVPAAASAAACALRAAANSPEGGAEQRRWRSRMWSVCL